MPQDPLNNATALPNRDLLWLAHECLQAGTNIKINHGTLYVRAMIGMHAMRLMLNAMLPLDADNKIELQDVEDEVCHVHVPILRRAQQLRLLSDAVWDAGGESRSLLKSVFDEFRRETTARGDKNWHDDSLPKLLFEFDESLDWSMPGRDGVGWKGIRVVRSDRILDVAVSMLSTLKRIAKLPHSAR